MSNVGSWPYRLQPGERTQGGDLYVKSPHIDPLPHAMPQGQSGTSWALAPTGTYKRMTEAVEGARIEAPLAWDSGKTHEGPPGRGD